MHKISIPTPLELSALRHSMLPNKNYNDATLAKPWCGDGEDILWFSTSAWSFLAVCQFWKRATSKESLKVWIPDFFCNPALAVIRKEPGLELLFYPITETFDPDWEACESLAVDTPPDLFFLVHYFGIKADAKKARRFCDLKESILVEDAAHIMMKEAGVGEFGDFVCYSPHKFFAIHDGAALVVRKMSKQLRRRYPIDPLETIKSIVADWRPVKEGVAKWAIKRSIRNLLPGWVLKKSTRRDQKSFFEDDLVHEYSNSPFQSNFSKILLQEVIDKGLEQLGEQRVRNYMAVSLVCDLDSRFGKPVLSHPKDAAPYLGLFKITDSQEFAEIFKKATSIGAPLQTWTDLPPEVRSNEKKHAVALKLRKSLWTFPVHQSLSFKQCNSLAIRLAREISPQEVRKKLSPLTFHPFMGEKSAWDSLMNQAEKNSLLQDWSYGEAKRDVEGWVPVRGVFEQEGSSLAMVQILMKKKGPIRLLRINRGPLFLNNLAPTQLEIKKVYQCLKRTFALGGGNLLFIAPNLPGDSYHKSLLHYLGFQIRASQQSWQSSWINLSMTENELRAQLKSKWRNMLNAAEKSGLTFALDDSDTVYHWMLERYRELMSEKGFQGMSIELLNSCRKNLRQGDFFVCRAVIDGEPVGGIILCQHGTSATYLVGWNGPEGRKLKANNFLLWHGLLELKRRGVHWFDLGGIDEVNTPEIAKFKQGMSGEAYSLVGEWTGFFMP